MRTDGQTERLTDRETDVTKLTVVSHNFANAPINGRHDFQTDLPATEPQLLLRRVHKPAYAESLISPSSTSVCDTLHTNKIALLVTI
jgi:hypothetical protein